MSGGQSANGKLLVVDDNEANRDMLARRLTKQGYDVDVAVDGPEALRKVEEQVPDLIVLDVMMPGMSGLEVLRYLRNLYDRVELPVLMATAKTDSEDVVAALAVVGTVVVAGFENLRLGAPRFRRTAREHDGGGDDLSAQQFIGLLGGGARAVFLFKAAAFFEQALICDQA